MSHLQRWIRHPQSVWLRKAIFQLHMWSGIGIGLYVLFISVTGSILVYRNELYDAATPAPVIVAATGSLLNDDDLKAAATRAYPGFAVTGMTRGHTPDEAVGLALENGTSRRDRLFNPYTGEDLGNSIPLGIKTVSTLLELHDDLLAGETGRRVNGIGGLLVIILAGTGLVVWWPGIQNWKRSLVIHRKVGWRRFMWDLHSMMGFWTLGIVLLFGLSGAYLSDSQPFHTVADWLQPPTDANAIEGRFVDDVTYWLAYLHFGRINGIGIPCSGPGLCDQAVKLAWALGGLAPAVLFVTGGVMWWNRVLRKKLGRARSVATIDAAPLAKG